MELTAQREPRVLLVLQVLLAQQVLLVLQVLLAQQVLLVLQVRTELTVQSDHKVQ
jgi:hypothetical protein